MSQVTTTTTTHSESLELRQSRRPAQATTDEHWLGLGAQRIAPGAAFLRRAVGAV